ncbi:MAG TPA: hypothetical protein PKD90_04895 [Phnomibacter sp.]|nr:hypothetical protein [Phnomibacter sp.]
MHPNLLPIHEIGSGFAPAIAIGREVATKAGYFDNLFVSPDGYLTIVETKLWKNPEARREVVGQIIDYAKELCMWSFTDLDQAVRSYNQRYNQHNQGLVGTVNTQYSMSQADELFFIDNLSRNLKRGRFLLLIAGDGIRESVEEMVAYLTQTPQIYFILALVELQIYTLPQANDAWVIIPQLVTRTREITRAIVKIEGSEATGLSVNIETDQGTEQANGPTAGNRGLIITA